MARDRIRPNPENATLEELDVAARCARTRAESDRLRAIQLLILQPEQRQLILNMHLCSERTLVRWIRAFNDRGIDGLLTPQRPGRPRAIAPDRVVACRQALEKPETAGRTHWTGRKFHGYLRDELQVEVAYATVLRFMHAEGYRLKVPQPWPDRQDEELRKAFCDKLKTLAEDADTDLWFGDETGVEGDPRPRRRWAKKGEKTRSTKNGDHIRMNVMGMVRPRTGECFLLEFSHSDSETFQAFLDEANKAVVFERQRNLLILDNASWHKTKSLEWGRFVPLYLPPYSPDLNPIERLWLIMKAEWFNNWYAKSHDELIERLDTALCWLIGRKEENVKTSVIKTRL